MKFANFLTKTKEFLIKRITELFGLLVIFVSIAILISIMSYSPDDPNFIFSQSTKIQNLLGFKGSIVSDFLFQSVGLISYLIPLTLFFSGVNILVNKMQIVFIDNLFFCILYVIFGCLFFSYFRDQSYLLTVNGSGGFVGLFLKDSFLVSIIELNQNISYYFLIILTFFLFLISINFKLNKVIYFINLSKNIIKTKEKKIDIMPKREEYVDLARENQNKKIQEILPFNNNSENNVKKFILPDLKLLKSPSRNETVAKKNEDINEEFLEKVISFSGLRDYISLPLKGYSEGMSNRLIFSILTSSKYECLALDEGFGASDASFFEKAKKKT